MTEARIEPLAVQIAPNDLPPFGDLCITYGRAFDSLGVGHRTIVLGSPAREPLPGLLYLGLDELNRVRRAGRALAAVLSGTEMVAICHRYRAYRVLRARGVRPPRIVTVAH